jgi:hypothetical protein
MFCSNLCQLHHPNVHTRNAAANHAVHAPPSANYSAHSTYSHTMAPLLSQHTHFQTICTPVSPMVPFRTTALVSWDGAGSDHSNWAWRTVK